MARQANGSARLLARDLTPFSLKQTWSFFLRLSVKTPVQLKDLPSLAGGPLAPDPARPSEANASALSSLAHTQSHPWWRITANNTTSRVIAVSPPLRLLFVVAAFSCTLSCGDAHTHTCTLLCVHVCAKCINRADCQRCSAVEVAVAVSLSSHPVASN